MLGDAPAHDTGYRQPPHNEEAEIGLLGGILSDNRAFDAVSDFLRPEHFYIVSHAKAYAAITGLIGRGRLANPVTVAGALSEADREAMGGHRYLTELVAASFSTVNAKDYGLLIHELALRRSGVRIAEDIADALYGADLDDSARSIIEDGIDDLDAAAGHSEEARPSVTAGEAMRLGLERTEAAMKAGTTITGIATGLPAVDRLLTGLQKQRLYVVAGATSAGKSALAQTVGLNAAKDGHRTALFTLEMSAEEIGQRFIAMETGISDDRQRLGDLTPDEFKAMFDAQQRLNDLPLIIDDNSAPSVGFLKQRCRRYAARGGIGLVIVDYLQLLVGQGRIENRTQEVSRITRDLKALAKDMDVPVVALAQLSREIDRRDDRRPRLSDLRESGSIEQDANVVIFVYRHEYYLAREEPKKRTDESDEKFNERYAKWQPDMAKARNRADLIVAKNRHGPAPRTLTVGFNGPRTLFHDPKIDPDGGIEPAPGEAEEMPF